MRQTVIPYFRLQFLLYQLCTNTRKCAHTGQCQVKSYFETGVCCQGCQHLETLKIANSVVSFIAFIRIDYLHSWELEKFGFPQNQGLHKKILYPHRFSAFSTCTNLYERGQKCSATPHFELLEQKVCFCGENN